MNVPAGGRKPRARWSRGRKGGCLLAILVFWALFAAILAVKHHYLTDRAWDSLSPERQRAQLFELADHYRPLVEGVSAYQDEHGCPPKSLRDVVPGYVDEVHPLEPGCVASFNYSVRVAYDLPGVRSVRSVYYELAAGGSKCRPSAARLSKPHWDNSQRHLVLVLDRQGVVQRQLVDGYPDSSSGRSSVDFDSERWKADPEIRGRMLGDIFFPGILLGQDLEAVRDLLGDPGGEVQLCFTWEMEVCLEKIDGLFPWREIEYFRFDPHRVKDPAVETFDGWTYHE